MLDIPALGPTGPYRTRNRTVVADASGRPALELASVPSLVVSHWIDQLRGSTPLPVAETAGVLKKAADVFEAQEILGDDLEAHERRVSALTGTPVTVVRECDRLITATLRDVGRAPSSARPTGCAPVGTAWPDAPSAGAAWCRTGDVFAVHAAGNSPGVHAMWLEALALGYRVVVRPSNRDPLTPVRLVTALWQAGVPTTQLVMAPCDHATADLIIERSDRALVYGGQDVVDKYRNRGDVRLQGPGRSKLVVTAEADRRAGVGLARTGALHHAGTACTATTGVLVEEDPAGFAGELAAALREVAPARHLDDTALLPCMPQADAERLVAAVLQRAKDATVHLAPRVERLGGEGSLATVTPAVVELASPRNPLLSYEVPFPCVWVAPFERGAADVLDGSLVLSLHTEDMALVAEATELTEVSNVYLGEPTSWAHPDVPHDGFLGEFLMRAKGLAHRRLPDQVHPPRSRSGI
ncbi:aldehyde dehydrogenase family protein [Streptomyces durmitorensis]|uniref:Aldehyde dehydrogenase family protein n=1 Tax=Streptomyces durmitorensis TaxID=319947 RepID=A0ABY4PQG5_9ACTN|nr:aldehyde dehydrogenase family protein [Streptomyces durmitorensis]UQT55966.1 aldehyde dehydrogenase family protein [Streptomyces durmitorensis]